MSSHPYSKSLSLQEQSTEDLKLSELVWSLMIGVLLLVWILLLPKLALLRLLSVSPFVPLNLPLGGPFCPSTHSFLADGWLSYLLSLHVLVRYCLLLILASAQSRWGDRHSSLLLHLVIIPLPYKANEQDYKDRPLLLSLTR
jgi:hypothetical protein